MIAKRITRAREKQQAKGDKQLFAYVINEQNKGRGDPTTWALAEYALDTAHDGEKVAWSRVTNCVSSDVGWAVKEILATQAKNTRSKTDKSYHLVISFPEGEKPTREQMEDIENEAVRAIGLQDHQRISAVHQNTDNWHLHVAINKVHPKTYRNVEPWYDQYRLQDACVVLEKKHGLHQDNHAETPEHIAAKASQIEAHAGQQSFLRWAKETAAEAIVDAVRAGSSWQDLHEALAQFDVEIKPRGAGLVIAHRQGKNWRVKASDVAREVGFKALTDRWGPYVPPGSVPAPAVPTAAAPPVVPPPAPAQAPTPATPPAPAQVAPQAPVPAPSVPSVPPPSPAPAAPFVGTPLHTSPGVETLWQRFQRERTTARQNRDAAVAALSAAHVAHSERIAAYEKQRMEAVKDARLSKADRLASYRHIMAERRKDTVTRIERERRERAECRNRHPVISWQAFLEREAAGGDQEALLALRSRARKRYPVSMQIISAPDFREAVSTVRANMSPFVARNGDVHYRIDDGGVVIDSARYVSVATITQGAIVLAIELSIQKYRDTEMVVHGTPAFESRVRDVAAWGGVPIHVRNSVAPSPAARHTVLVTTNNGIGHGQSNQSGNGRTI